MIIRVRDADRARPLIHAVVDGAPDGVDADGPFFVVPDEQADKVRAIEVDGRAIGDYLTDAERIRSLEAQVADLAARLAKAESP